jgi:hypothetical protein
MHPRLALARALLLAPLLVAVLGLAATALAKTVGGGSGVIADDGRVGVLRLDQSRAVDVEATAGAPAVTSIGDFQGSGAGQLRDSKVFPSFLVFGYGCISHPARHHFDPTPYAPTHEYCTTIYYFSLGSRRYATRQETLSAVWTGSASFETAGGTRPGLSQTVANRREVRGTPVFGCHRGIESSSARADLLVQNVGGRPLEKTRNGVTHTTGVAGGYVDSLEIESKRNPVALLFC